MLLVVVVLEEETSDLHQFKEAMVTVAIPEGMKLIEEVFEGAELDSLSFFQSLVLEVEASLDF